MASGRIAIALLVLFLHDRLGESLRANAASESRSCSKACLQTGFPNRQKIDSRPKNRRISLDSIDVERRGVGTDCTRAAR
jgi:hypothetical protein